MIRTPTSEGPPRCWGRYRGDSECESCDARGTCRAATRQFIAVNTVAEAVAEQRSRIGEVHQTTPEALAAAAFAAFKEYGGNGHVRSWASDENFLEAMRQVIVMCVKSKWDARTFITGQMQSLIPAIRLGHRIYPGHFIGDNAVTRFKNWVSRYEQRYGNARLEAEAEQVSRARAKQAAVNAYMTARLYYGHDRVTSLEMAQEFCAKWKWEDATHEEMLEGLNSALVAIDPLLPHMVLMPTTWKWADLRDLFRRVCPERTADEGSALVLSPSLGELL